MGKGKGIFWVGAFLFAILLAIPLYLFWPGR